MSVVFQGAQGEQIEQTVIGILKTFIETKFASEPYLTRMSAWSGVKVTDTDEDADRFVATASPFIFMSIAEGSHTRELFRKNLDGTLYMGTQHNIDVVMELYVTERCRNAIKPLRDAIGNMIDVGYAELQELGLYATSIRPTSNSSQGAQLFNPHTVSCMVFTIPKLD